VEWDWEAVKGGGARPEGEGSMGAVSRGEAAELERVWGGRWVGARRAERQVLQ